MSMGEEQNGTMRKKDCNRHGPSGVSTRKEIEIRGYQRTWRCVSVVGQEDREHEVQDKGACGGKFERGN